MVKHTGLNGETGTAGELCVCIQPCCYDNKLVVLSSQVGAGKAHAGFKSMKKKPVGQSGSPQICLVPAAPASQRVLSLSHQVKRAQLPPWLTGAGGGWGHLWD